MPEKIIEKINNIQAELINKLDEINQNKNEEISEIIKAKDEEEINKTRQEIKELN